MAFARLKVKGMALGHSSCVIPFAVRMGSVI